MSIIKKVILTNMQVFNIVAWYNNDFKANEKNKELPIKLQLELQRNISSLMESAQTYEKLCKSLILDTQNEYLSEEKSNKVKKIEKDENGEEKEVFNHVLKEEFQEEYNKKINEVNEKIEEISKEEETYSIRVFDLDNFVNSLSDSTSLTVDDLFMLTFMDENSEKIVEE